MYLSKEKWVGKLNENNKQDIVNSKKILFRSKYNLIKWVKEYIFFSVFSLLLSEEMLLSCHVFSNWICKEKYVRWTPKEAKLTAVAKVPLKLWR